LDRPVRAAAGVAKAGRACGISYADGSSGNRQGSFNENEKPAPQSPSVT